jgi:hypothetical protein
MCIHKDAAPKQYNGCYLSNKIQCGRIGGWELVQRGNLVGGILGDLESIPLPERVLALARQPRTNPA